MPEVQTAHAYLTATLTKIPLRTILDVTAPEHFGDLGFDTAVSGPVKVEWGGPATDMPSSVQVDANLKLAPSGVSRKGALANIPVSGVVVAHYNGRSQIVNIKTVNVHTPATVLVANGVLGVNNGDPLTDLQVNMQVRDLAEFEERMSQTPSADSLDRIFDCVAITAAPAPVTAISYFVADGRFIDTLRAAATGAGVVTDPIGVHPALIELVWTRYDEALGAVR